MAEVHISLMYQAVLPIGDYCHQLPEKNLFIATGCADIKISTMYGVILHQ